MTRTDLPQYAVADLLADYCPGESFFFSSPRSAMLASGEAILLPDRLADLPTYVSDLLAALGGEVPDRVVVGALPFAGLNGARLVVPVQVRRAGPISAAGLSRSPGPTTRVSRVLAVPDAQRYRVAVERAVSMVRAGDLQKVVLARCLQIDLAAPVDVRAVLRSLAWRDPRGYTYAVDLSGGRTLVGASPELLVSRIGERVVANPLAGSLPRAADPVEDSRRAAALRTSLKDGREHAFVVEAVVEALRPYLKRIQVPAEPAAVPTASMWHLSTRVTGEVVDPSVTAFHLATALHPTPAICGTPVEAARTVISQLEPFDRGFYSGMVGWVDADGDGEWIVGIRCAETDGQSLRLYAGAGIVAESSPAAELAETAAKFQTLLAAMGIPGEM
ncbi:isochorismate synthase [Solwaraspora sp. WMMB335]|uniref:isochorismate synthase n=1 Tax=Solwaraspora sp. WMMB335 TaxID=3404118 RepID=UPI003B9574DA